MESYPYRPESKEFKNAELQLCYARQNIEMAKLALKEVGEEYRPSRSELAAAAFEESIPYIEKLILNIHHYLGGEKTWTFSVKDGQLYVDMHILFQRKTESACPKPDYPITKEELFHGLKELHIGEWNRRYDTPDVLDGECWSLEISFSNLHKPVEIFGYNAYPYNFNALLKLLHIEHDF